MHGASGRAQTWSLFDRQPTPLASSSSPAPSLRPLAGPSRSSSVTFSSPTSGPRFRTILHPEDHDDRELRQKFLQSRSRLLSSFDAIAEKYGSVAPEEVDEIDLLKLDLSKRNGHLDALEPRLFAEGDDYLGEAVEDDHEGIRLDLLRLHSEPIRGPEQVEFGEDEDELGDWDDRSGLDAQFPLTEVENEWTAEDLHDLNEFMQAEEARRARFGEAPLSEGERVGGPSSSPLQRLSHLVRGASPEVEDDVMGESAMRKDSRVNIGSHEAVSNRPERTLITSIFTIPHQLRLLSHTFPKQVHPRAVDIVPATPAVGHSSCLAPLPACAALTRRPVATFLGLKQSAVSCATRLATLFSTRKSQPASSPSKTSLSPHGQGRARSALCPRCRRGRATGKPLGPCDDRRRPTPLLNSGAEDPPRLAISSK